MDTNIVISTLIASYGEPAKVFKKMIGGEIENYTSKEIMGEVIEVLNREEITKRTELKDRQHILEQYLLYSKIVNPVKKHNVLEHESDNKFIDVAIKAKANFIISGDKHLLEKKEFKNIKIIRAKEYLQDDSNGK
jgi:putative PIN family toxin of toxin-antitoxin system